MNNKTIKNIIKIIIVFICIFAIFSAFSTKTYAVNNADDIINKGKTFINNRKQ